jgi:hypothetical protein
MRAARARISLVHHDTHASQDQKHAMVGALHAQPPNSTHSEPRHERQSEQRGHHTTSAMGCVTECHVGAAYTAPSDHNMQTLCSAKLHVVVLERSAQKSLAAHARMRVSQRASRCHEPCGDPSACSIDIIACVRTFACRAQRKRRGRRQMELYPKQLQGTQQQSNCARNLKQVAQAHPT